MGRPARPSQATVEDSGQLEPAIVADPDKAAHIAAQRAQAIYQQTLEAAQIAAQTAVSRALTGDAEAMAPAIEKARGAGTGATRG